MRDNTWLEEKLEELWENYYADVPRKNKVTIKFGKRAKRVLGSIKYYKRMQAADPEYDLHEDKKISQITMTKFFVDEDIPDDVVIGTIAHEMVHYAHGFNSPLERRYNHPHKGGIIKKEMYARGLADLYEKSEGWVKKNWVKYLKAVGALKPTRRRRSRRRIVRDSFLFGILRY
jgi:hypothetical protein